MDIYGYTVAEEALAKNLISCEIYPPFPEDFPEKYNERYIEMRNESTVTFHSIVNALAESGLMGLPYEEPDQGNGLPHLEIRGIAPGCILLEDVNYQPK
jgi:hypothetical protein